MASEESRKFDVVIIGAGAAGLMCAIEAGRRGRKVLLLEKAEKCGKKILISGGGRCNFTNLFAAPDKFISDNPHFCKSALSQYTQSDFIALVEKHRVAYHEKKLGQLFCDGSASEIVALLETECAAHGVIIWRGSGADKVEKEDDHFLIATGGQVLSAKSLVVATGGLSIPKIGANDFAYRVAKAFGLALVPARPGLAPLTFEAADKKRFARLTGISADVSIGYEKTRFRENLLFTHRGLSGPAILQISSFWELGKPITIDFLPDIDLEHILKEKRQPQPRTKVSSYLKDHLASRLVDVLLEEFVDLPELGNCSDKTIREIVKSIKLVKLVPVGTEGYAKAEVTVGGVSTEVLHSKTMECRSVPGLFFIGEAVDVTGFLGGYNFQWAWSSGYVAGQYA
ncbi:aminoacetone oxidase family FAD-binding enzyme [Sneathiella chungangensis]|uniref:Aminoacetone oxidase family FAD-binding enzyme n=1 Tax=Sneathiella chungangensis TaxID=1418234 RepID=A0A845MJB9_9PROT|nr:NAD(P)/FAD-dependent oxidoreductase [Sneathiella chungangensis]MZR23520.1 aminoacetone oxidase family FAD-binding enzyme [Sneathiella chungangensis]